MGYDVAVPLTESAAYELILDDGDGLHRVQCKYVATREGASDGSTPIRAGTS
jgi:PD-(D/E)XK endonuclease